MLFYKTYSLIRGSLSWLSFSFWETLWYTGNKVQVYHNSASYKAFQPNPKNLYSVSLCSEYFFSFKISPNSFQLHSYPSTPSPDCVPTLVLFSFALLNLLYVYLECLYSAFLPTCIINILSSPSPICHWPATDLFSFKHNGCIISFYRQQRTIYNVHGLQAWVSNLPWPNSVKFLQFSFPFNNWLFVYSPHLVLKVISPQVFPHQVVVVFLLFFWPSWILGYTSNLRWWYRKEEKKKETL